MPLIVKTAAEIAAEELARQRAGMKAYRRSFRAALAERPISESPALGAAVPGAPNMLVALDTYVDALDPYDPQAMTWRDVVQFERANPDVDAFFVAALGLSDEWVDDLFERAQEIEWP